MLWILPLKIQIMDLFSTKSRLSPCQEPHPKHSLPKTLRMSKRRAISPLKVFSLSLYLLRTSQMKSFKLLTNRRRRRYPLVTTQTWLQQGPTGKKQPLTSKRSFTTNSTTSKRSQTSTKGKWKPLRLTKDTYKQSLESAITSWPKTNKKTSPLSKKLWLTAQSRFWTTTAGLKQ